MKRNKKNIIFILAVFFIIFLIKFFPNILLVYSKYAQKYRQEKTIGNFLKNEEKYEKLTETLKSEKEINTFIKFSTILFIRYNKYRLNDIYFNSKKELHNYLKNKKVTKIFNNIYIKLKELHCVGFDKFSGNLEFVRKAGLFYYGIVYVQDKKSAFLNYYKLVFIKNNYYYFEYSSL